MFAAQLRNCNWFDCLIATLSKRGMKDAINQAVATTTLADKLPGQAAYAVGENGFCSASQVESPALMWSLPCAWVS